jgi:outer membrane protein TolC
MKDHGRNLALLGWVLISSAAFGAEPWTLEHALERALADNPDTQLARYRITAAQAGVNQANAAFWPRVQLQSSYTQTDNPMMVFGSILNQRTYSSSLNFDDVPDVDKWNIRGVVTMPFYAGGRNKAAREAAKANTEAARQDAAAVRNVLGFEVARSFYTLLKTREFIRAAEAALSSFQTNVVTASKRLEGGTSLKTDFIGPRGPARTSARGPGPRPQCKRFGQPRLAQSAGHRRGRL